MFEDPKNVKKYLKISLFGDGGSGKTRFALGFPGPLCVIDTEDGTAPYRKKYDFKVKHLTRWNDLKAVVDWVRSHPAECQTLVIDSVTVFYQSLINEITDEIRNTRKTEVLSFGEWGKIKRRWSALMIALTGLPCHVILCMRERDEYEETVNYKGEEVRKRTGNHFMDADKTTKYLFDISIRCSVERQKKEKTAKYLATVDKSRYDWIPIFTTYDITGKRAWKELFEKHVSEMSVGAEPVAVEGETFVVEHTQENPTPESVAKAAGKVAADAAKVAENLPPAKSTVERNGETLGKFTGQGDKDAPQATAEEIKVLMTTCGKLTWPDGTKFKSTDGKAMIKGLYKLESTIDLRKYQVDFLYREFCEVLAGRAELALDESGMPYVRPLSGVKQ